MEWLNLGTDPSTCLTSKKGQTENGKWPFGLPSPAHSWHMPLCHVNMLCQKELSSHQSPLAAPEPPSSGVQNPSSPNLFIACLGSFVPMPTSSFGLNRSPSLVFIILMYLQIAIRSHLSFHFTRLNKPTFSQSPLLRQALYSPPLSSQSFSTPVPVSVVPCWQMVRMKVLTPGSSGGPYWLVDGCNPE